MARDFLVRILWNKAVILKVASDFPVANYEGGYKMLQRFI